MVHLIRQIDRRLGERMEPDLGSQVGLLARIIERLHRAADEVGDEATAASLAGDPRLLAAAIVTGQPGRTPRAHRGPPLSPDRPRGPRAGG
jgi:hypothetical protein